MDRQVNECFKAKTFMVRKYAHSSVACYMGVKLLKFFHLSGEDWGYADVSIMLGLTRTSIIFYIPLEAGDW